MPVPPEAIDMIAPFEPERHVTAVTIGLIAMAVGWVMVTAFTDLHALASVIVSVYVLADKPVMLAPVALLLQL